MKDGSKSRASINKLGLPPRIHKLLVGANILTIGKLASQGKLDILEIKGIGPTALEIINRALITDDYHSIRKWRKGESVFSGWGSISGTGGGGS